MVEGPGATRNGRKASRFIKHRIQLVQHGYNNSIITDGSNKTAHWWSDRFLSKVLTVGKELYLIFSPIDSFETNKGDLALRLHFGMNGSFRVISSTSDNNFPNLRLIFGDKIGGAITNNGNSFTTSIIEACQTTVSDPFSAKIAHTKYDALATCDVCSDLFQPENVIEKMKNNSRISGTNISDQLLNQSVFPGVGNIIKVEGLHDARVHPKRPFNTLTNEELRLVVLACRSYALKWLGAGKAPPKSVYNQTICGSCGEAKISMQRVGNSGRTTFWCTQCQPLMHVDNASKSLTDHQHQFQSNKPYNYTSNEEATQRNDTSKKANAKNSKTEPVMSNSRCFRRVCPTHGPNSLILRRVRNGINESRIFHTCKIKQCKYFSWADRYFPCCNCKKLAMFRISKTERTGGKWFFSCRSNKKETGRHKSGCNYFAWASSKDLERLGNMLTPLL
mmetsp:Transcript_9326/g.10843  ORF Transcript_9326/g.10843 Transcript_9326/m.10843 type:complete len:448 (+) Transcript_9326:29-1372(+)